MKDKIFAQLIAKYKGKNLSKNFLEAIAKQIEAGITEESEIEGRINELDALILETASEADRRVSEALKKPKEKDPKKEDKPKDDDQDENNPDRDKKIPPADEAPAWAKDLIQTVNTLKAEKAASTAKEKFAKLIGKEVPEAMYKRLTLPESDEDLTTLADELKAEFKELQQSDANNSFGSDKPFSGSGGDGNKTATKEEVDQIMNTIM